MRSQHHLTVLITALECGVLLTCENVQRYNSSTVYTFSHLLRSETPNFSKNRFNDIGYHIKKNPSPYVLLHSV